MPRVAPDAMPTMRQFTVLRTIGMGQKMTAKAIGVRSDVLWRMEEAGWVARTHDRWFIYPAGKEAIDRYEKLHQLGIHAPGFDGNTPEAPQSRFYVADPDDPRPPVVLTEYTSEHHGLIRVGDQVAYENPNWRRGDGSYLAGGMDKQLEITEIIDLGAGFVNAILNGGKWEVCADHLRPIEAEPEVGS